MRSRTLLSTTIALSAAVALGLGLTAARREPAVMRVDFGKTITATNPAYDARVTPVADPSIKEFIIPITHDTVEIAKGVKYEGWTFGGTVPGPVLRVRQGDLVRDCARLIEQTGDARRAERLKRQSEYFVARQDAGYGTLLGDLVTQLASFGETRRRGVA